MAEQRDSGVRNVAIIGSGPAGYTAAVYAARANLKPVLVDGIQPGGQLTITTDVENYPGFPEGILGPDLMDNFRKQAERFGTELVGGTVTKVDFGGGPPFTLTVDGKDEIRAHTVIVATGASAKWLDIPSEQALRGYGVSACATCDGFFFRDVPIAVVGGGDTAMEEATFLTKFASKVHLIHRRDQLRASKIMQARAERDEKITFEWNSVVREVHGTKEDGVTSLTLEDTVTGKTRELKVNGLFIAIGHKPNTEVFEGALDLEPTGYVRLVEPGTTKTSVPGVFVAGDAADPVYRQAVTAAGTGCMAALDAERHLAHEGLV